MQQARQWRDDILYLVALGAVVRLALVLVYAPQSYPDTGTYFDLARRIEHSTLLTYGGQRTPGYPLLLLAAGLNPYVVWLLQALMGIAISALSYFIVALCSPSRRAALVSGAVHSLALNQVFFEANLLSETAATFWIVLSMVLFALTIRRPGTGLPGWLGIVSAMAALTRPIYLVLAPVYALLLLFGMPRGCALRVTAIFSVTLLVPILLWASVNKAATGKFTMTTLTGYSLSNHAGGFFELAPEKDALIRDIYLKHREERRSESPSHTHANTAIAARSELLQRTGLSPVDLSGELARISLALFYAHPLLYAKSVLESWTSFWAVPNFWRLGDIRPPLVQKSLQSAWRVEQSLMRVANLAFVMLSAFVAITFARKWRLLRQGDLVALALIAVIWSSSLLQALFEYGDNPRFAIPTEPLVVCFLAWAAVAMRRSFRLFARHRLPA